jgi:methylmalonyl-CoA mutase cobalamin-binding subunit
VIAELKKYGREDIMVVVGGYSFAGLSILFDAGAVAVLVLEQKSAMLL